MGIVLSASGAGQLIGGSTARATPATASDLVASPATWLEEPGSLIAGGWWSAAHWTALARHTVVRRALLKHADAEASVRLHVMDPATKERIAPADPGMGGMFADLLANGTPIGHHRARHWTAMTRRKFGHAPWVLGRNAQGIVDTMVPVSPLLLSWNHQLMRWEFHGRTAMVPLPERDVMLFPNYLGDSGSIRSGVSSLETVQSLVEADKAMAESLHGWWKRGARPGVVLRHPKTLSKEARTNLKESWSNAQEGSKNAGRSALLEEGMDVTVLPFNAVDAELVDSRTQNWEEACVALDVPPPLVHLHQRSTFNNVTELHTSWYRDIVAPGLLYLTDDWQRLASEPMFGAPVPVEVEYDLDAILWGSPLQRAAVLKDAEWLTVAEKRGIESVKQLPGTDRILVNGAMVPLDRLDDTIDRRTQPTGGPRQVAWSAADVDQVLGQLHVRSLDDVDVERATSGLPDGCADQFAAMLAMASSPSQLRAMVATFSL